LCCDSKNNAAAAETTYQNGIAAREHKSGLFFDDSLDQVFINLPSMALPPPTSAVRRFPQLFVSLCHFLKTSST
jgi:hypothetical protein